MSRKILVFGFILLVILAIRFFLFYQGRQVYKDGQQITFSTIILSEPQFVSNRQSLSANLPNGERVYITSTTENSFNYGDNLNISGTLKNRLLSSGNNIWTMSYPQIKVEANNLKMFAGFRQKIISLFGSILPQTSSSLMVGIVFGIKEQMNADFVKQLRNVGVMHVIVASGMNVVMVGGFLSSIFSYFFKRQVALMLSLFGIMFYAVLAGLGPSILRASIMGGLVFLSQIIGRQSFSSYTLFLSAFAMFFVSPTLISDVGFQLSFVATAGLLYIRPLFEMGKLKTIMEKSIVGEDVATTIAAQVSTLPILLANFGILSFWSVVVNALVLWTVPILMIIGGIGFMLGVIFHPLGQFVIYFSIPFLLYFEKVVSVFGNAGAINISGIPWQFIAGYYLLVIALVLFLCKK
jgi:competence protein ComEC